MSPQASELYSVMISQHLDELTLEADTADLSKDTPDSKPLGKSKNVPDKSAILALGNLCDSSRGLFLQTWLDPVVNALAGTNRKVKQNVIEYLLPKLLKIGPHVLNYMVQQLALCGKADAGKPGHNQHGPIIMCLRRARAMGLFKLSPKFCQSDTQPPRLDAHLDALDTSMLKLALSSADEQVRLDAFALVVENHKTTEAISAFEFEMVKFFIPSNLNNQLPSFRQAFAAIIKKVFT